MAEQEKYQQHQWDKRKQCIERERSGQAHDVVACKASQCFANDKKSRAVLLLCVSVEWLLHRRVFGQLFKVRKFFDDECPVSILANNVKIASN